MKKLLLVSLLLLAAAAVVLACTAPVSVTVTPGTLTIGLNNTQQFTATVTGNPLSTTSVTWEVNSIVGGNSTIGTVSSGGLYTAPASVPTPATVSVTAVSVADTSKSATAAVTISATAPESLAVAIVGSGSVSSSPAGISCPSTCSASFSQGTGVTLTETPGGGYNFSAWSGDCSGTGTTAAITMNAAASCTATFVPSSSGSCTGAFTISSQEPPSCQAYPGTIWTTTLPGDVASHLYPNSDAIISHIFGGSISNGYPSFFRASSVGGGYGGTAQHYCGASCKLFKVASAVFTGTGTYNIVGKYFHLPAGACFAGTSNADQYLGTWDLSTDIDATAGGRKFWAYHFSGAPPCLPASCACTTKACADSTPACQLNLYYADVDYPQNDSTPYAHSAGAYDSGKWSPGAGLLRSAELVAGIVNHALMINTHCLYSPSGNRVPAAPVFPAIANAIGCPFTDSLRPVNGNLLFLDSGYNCSGSGVAGWQTAVCKALQSYGAYQHDTGGNDMTGFWVDFSGHEGPDAYAFAGIHEPVMNWFRQFTNFTSGSGIWSGQNGLKVYTDSSGNAYYVVAPFFNLPGALSHLHLAAPCIAIHQAGLGSWNGTSACS